MTLDDSMSLVDIHSHLVPGVDDGARHVPGVLNAIERMTHAWIRRVVTTPSPLLQRLRGMIVRRERSMERQG